MKKRIFALTLTLALLCGCTGGKAVPTPAPSTAPPPSPTAVTTPAPTEDTADKTEVRLAVLSGPSGMGAVKLMADSEAGRSQNHYNVTIATQNDEVTAGLSRGSLDAAAVASNVASILYNKTEGEVQAVAVTGLGVLYLLENGTEVQSLTDLKGKTLYATGQGANPEYVLNYLLQESGVAPSEVNVEWRTAEEVSALMLSGEATLCMLPVPAATGVLKKNPDVRQALDFTDLWNALNNGSQLTQTVLVVRKGFADENPEAVGTLLEEYGASIDYVNQNVAEAAALVAGYGITPNVAIAEAAIPQCNLVFLAGSTQVREAVQGYYEILWQADPKAVGGSLPDDAFYYGG